jgi:DNA-binding transcriptional LysR family regulator
MPKGFRFPEHRYFFELATSRSLRKAAEALHISPSALSRQIRRIEDLLGAQVIERGTTGIRLTTAGEYLFQHIKDSYASEERLLAKLDEISGMDRGHIRIACGDGFLPDLLGESFEAFSRKHPGISFEIKLAGRDFIIRSVVEEEADVGFIFFPPPDQRLVTIARSRQPLHAVMSPAHQLARKRTLSLRSVSEHPLALLVPAHGVRQAIDVEARKARIKLEPRFVCNSVTALRVFAERYGALTLLPKFAALPELKSGRLVFVPLTEPFFRTTEAVLFAKRSRELTLPVTEFARALASGMNSLASN